MSELWIRYRIVRLRIIKSSIEMPYSYDVYVYRDQISFYFKGSLYKIN